MSALYTCIRHLKNIESIIFHQFAFSSHEFVFDSRSFRIAAPTIWIRSESVSKYLIRFAFMAAASG